MQQVLIEKFIKKNINSRQYKGPWKGSFLLVNSEENLFGNQIKSYLKKYKEFIKNLYEN